MKRLILGVLAALCLLPAVASAQVITSTPPSCAAPPGNTTLPVLNCGLSDIKLFRDAANTLALRNGASAQTFNVYGTYTDASNFESLYVKGTGTEFRIGTAHAGTGTARPLYLESDSTGRWQVTTSGHFLAFTDNTYDIGASGANRPRNGYFAGFVAAGGTLEAGSAQQLSFASRTKLTSSADGNLLLQNNALTSFGLLQFGGTTSSFPALKRSGTELQSRLADDTAFADFRASTITATTTLTAASITSTSTVKTQGTTVSGLGAASSAGAGARAYVTDATACTFATTVTGGGSTACPVYSDGTNWKAG